MLDTYGTFNDIVLAEYSAFPEMVSQIGTLQQVATLIDGTIERGLMDKPPTLPTTKTTSKGE
jgi:hypothetical protein